MPFNNYPYTNLNDLNLDFLLKNYKGIAEAAETVGAAVEAVEAAKNVVLANQKLLPRSIKNSPGAITRVLKAAGSYVRRTDMVYGNFHGALNTNCVKVGGKWEIDCSTFAQLVAQGIDFENSRYSGKTSNTSIGGFHIPVDEMYINPAADRPYGMLSGDFAHWCYDNGFWYETSDVWEVQPGDIVFINTGLESDFRNVSHCAVALGAYGYQLLTIEADNNTPQPITRKAWRIGGQYGTIVGFARLPYVDMLEPADDAFNNPYMAPSVLLSPVNVNIAAGNSAYTLKTIRLPANLEYNQPYTLVVEADFRAGERITLMGSNGEYTTMMPFRRTSTMAWRVFYANERSDVLAYGPATDGSYAVNLQLIIDPQSETYQRTVNLYNVRLFKGVVIPASTVAGDPENDRHNFVGTIQHSTWDSFKAAMDAETAIGPTEQFKRPIISQLTASGAEVLPGRYMVFTILFGPTLPIGTQFLVGIGSARLYTRYKAGSTWTAFHLTEL